MKYAEFLLDICSSCCINPSYPVDYRSNNQYNSFIRQIAVNFCQYYTTPLRPIYHLFVSVREYGLSEREYARDTSTSTCGENGNASWRYARYPVQCPNLFLVWGVRTSPDKCAMFPNVSYRYWMIILFPNYLSIFMLVGELRTGTPWDYRIDETMTLFAILFHFYIGLRIFSRSLPIR